MMREFFKHYLLQPICYIVLILITLFILNQFTYFNISLSSNNNYNSFEVIGTGKVSVTPQDARISFVASGKGATQEAAKNAANNIQNQAISALTSLGIPKANITTNSISVNPNYEEQTTVQPLIYPPARSVQNGYIATVNTQVKGTISQINNAVDKLSTLGANVSGVEYVSSDQTKLTEQAQAKAIENAKEQAQNIAKAAGFKLGKIVSVRNADDMQGGLLPYANTSLKAGAPEDSTNLQPGTNEVVSNMGVTFYIKN